MLAMPGPANLMGVVEVKTGRSGLAVWGVSGRVGCGRAVDGCSWRLVGICGKAFVGTWATLMGFGSEARARKIGGWAAAAGAGMAADVRAAGSALGDALLGSIIDCRTSETRPLDTGTLAF